MRKIKITSQEYDSLADIYGLLDDVQRFLPAGKAKIEKMMDVVMSFMLRYEGETDIVENVNK